MWQSSSKNSTSISPNLIKNFNVFEVLEPQKCTATLNVEKLIDIDDDCNSTQNDDIVASFNDKTSNYDLVDLFQNIFVSPQHVIKKETIELVEDNTNIDYKDFCDKLESGVKIDWTNSEKHESKDDFSQYDIKPKILEPPKDLDSDCDPDELIDEIMTSKNIERQILSQIPKDIENSKTLPTYETTNKQSNITENEYVTNKPIAASLKYDHRNSLDYKTQFPCDEINNNKNNQEFKVNTKIKDEKAFRRKRIVTPEVHKLHYTKGPDIYEKTIVLPQIMKRIKERERVLREDNSLKARLVLDSGADNSACSRHISKECVPGTSKSTEVAFKDSVKAFDNVRTAYKGASELNRGFSTNDVNKTSNSTTSLGNFNPVTLMEDCNKERLLAWKRGQAISNLVRAGKI